MLRAFAVVRHIAQADLKESTGLDVIPGHSCRPFFRLARFAGNRELSRNVACRPLAYPCADGAGVPSGRQVTLVHARWSREHGENLCIGPRFAEFVRYSLCGS